MPLLRSRNGTPGALEVGGVYPRLPGAVTRLPDWVGTGAPFDVAKYFSAPARAVNAAPIYLDGFFEFSDELVVCFPEGPERDRRRQAAEYRGKQYRELAEALFKDEKVRFRGDDRRGHHPPCHGLQEARRGTAPRKVCFRGWHRRLALLPHLQGARQVTRIASASRASRRGASAISNAAIRDVEMVLRLARDLQPRGGIFGQLVAAAITQVVGADMLPRLLASSELGVRDCNRLHQECSPSTRPARTTGMSRGFEGSTWSAVSRSRSSSAISASLPSEWD